MKNKNPYAVLRTLRIEADLTQAELAEKLGHSQSYVSKYENGEQRLDLIEIGRICDAVEISLVEFVKRYCEA